MDIQTLVITSLIVAAGGTVAFLIKDIPVKIFNWAKRKSLYSVSIYQQDELFDVVEDWFFAHYKNRYNDVEAVLNYRDQPAVVGGLNKELKFKQEENFFIARVAGKRILISKSKEKLDKAVSLRDIYYRKYIIRGFMAKQEINDLLAQIVKEYNDKSKSGIIKVFTNNSYGDWVCVNDISVKSFDLVVLESGLKSSLISDVDDFIASEQWYKKRSIRHKRGYLFHGLPGNGKTTLAMAIAEHLSRDIYVMNLNALQDDGCLIRAFSNIGKNIVLLVEDIDRAFSKRENKDSKISFSSLLNSFDGATCRDGIITVVTTNHLEQLDPALTREGRMDVKHEIKNPPDKQVKEYLELFYEIKISVDIHNSDRSMSYVQEYCIKNKGNSLAAINHFSADILKSVNL